jgi:hypothetical protein
MRRGGTCLISSLFRGYCDERGTMKVYALVNADVEETRVSATLFSVFDIFR